jgi:hypothetical protein
VSNLIHVPAETPIQRGSRGRFAPGNRGGPGRLKEFTVEKEKFAEAMRREVTRRKLAPERMGAMAAGEGKYAKLSAKFQHEITMDMLAYGYGRPAQLQVVSTDDMGAIAVKRIVGIDDANV